MIVYEIVMVIFVIIFNTVNLFQNERNINIYTTYLIILSNSREILTPSTPDNIFDL